MQKLKNILEYYDMINSLTRRDLRGKYKGSVLGFLWTFLVPLCQIIVYTIVFSNIFRNGLEHFYIYLSIGMIPWLFFNEALTQGAGAIVNQADMTKKIYFPREVLPISVVNSRFINMLLSYIIVFIFIFFSGVGFKLPLLPYLLLVFLVEYILALGGSILLSALTVYFRDVEYIVGVAMMAWIWMTPIMYATDAVPEKLDFILKLNPMSPIIMAYHDILYYQVTPNVLGLLMCFVFSVLFLIVGEIIFTHLEYNFAEEL